MANPDKNYNAINPEDFPDFYDGNPTETPVTNENVGDKIVAIREKLKTSFESLKKLSQKTQETFNPEERSKIATSEIIELKEYLKDADNIQNPNAVKLPSLIKRLILEFEKFIID